MSKIKNPQINSDKGVQLSKLDYNTAIVVPTSAPLIR